LESLCMGNGDFFWERELYPALATKTDISGIFKLTFRAFHIQSSFYLIDIRIIFNRRIVKLNIPINVSKNITYPWAD